MPVISRRRFVNTGLMGLGSLYVTTLLSGCDGDDDDKKLGDGSFAHGIASGDPLATSVILWTRVTPAAGTPEKIRVQWEVAEDEGFSNIIARDQGDALLSTDYTVKVDIRDLSPDTHYYYRFSSANQTTAIGHTRTLPDTSADQLKMGVISCSNYPAGYFHVYAALAEQNLDLILHLGDYIYEYGADGYASEEAVAMGRVVQPAGELLTLDDYRTRYAQYRSDPDLQKAHASTPFLVVWDDHEVANDSWENGAENHSADEGSYADRKLAALRAYFEWLPIRPFDAMDNSDLANPSHIYRQFEWGDLANLLMLDTRHEARVEAVNVASFFNTTDGSFDFTGLFAALNDPSRHLLGEAQESWLQSAMSSSTATWQVLGQQVLMGKMYLPFGIATQQMSFEQYAELGQLAQLAARAQASDPTLTAAELAYLQANQAKLTPQVVAMLQAPAIPYNMDAWDGFGAARERVYDMAKAADANLVVLAGDTHNAWANNLSNAAGDEIGVEFATSSVSSPGLEAYMGIAPAGYAAAEAGIVSIVDGLQYLNAGDRGYLVLDINHERVVANWSFVSSVKAASYTMQTERAKSLKVTAGTKHIQSV
ncbi:alkaline phosphatase D family protein [Teredinibacter turnerae]|uniref:alkaline phosphatase D family protein n=1 Tax=Teredinibacter turnerae TaxID=2426 RepID=UPI0030CB2A44